MTRKNRTRLPIIVCTAVLLVAMLTTIFASVLSSANGSLGESPLINKYNGSLNVDTSQFYDGTVIYKLPASVKDTDEISLIIQIGGESLLDVYEDMTTTQSFSEFYVTDKADKIRADVAKSIEKMCGKLTTKGIEYSTGVSYSTLFNGFEIIVKAGDFVDVCQTLGSKANVIVGDVYNVSETKLVENDVNAFKTGIFDTTGFGYDGSGMVIAVLDTGTDYYHTAFSTGNFTSNSLGLTKDQLAALLAEKDFTAEKTTPGITAEDVYISEKLPYGYDYADKDTDVFPINNHHGTHVAGIIAGKDDTITGVAPNAQIVTMKIFSDVESSARTSWIMAALEDCVALGVDVINMSIGTACGFSRETDKEANYKVFDKIRDHGINMVVAASNSFNSAYSSEKNGNLPLTSNPDSSTVGSPSTYEGALSVASIEGAKTSYLLYNGTIIYFEESTDRVSEEKNFVKELLGSDKTELEIEYVVIPGAGLEADYMGIDVKGKIALIKRGNTTFEEKSNTAEKMGAAGAIIYNNVSGDIKMNVGETTIPVCSISQDDGELLAAVSSGKIKVSTSQAAGPFMSDFSSWGPTPDLGIKPEITAHGGSILSAVPGQDYDRISGTSMATPNITGVTALLLQYVKANPQLFPAAQNSDAEAGAIVNRLMMSTADIIYGKNGNPYAVRKQGAGLADLIDSSTTTAYILTYDREDNSVMDKSKIELGDDPKKTGVYTLVFTIDNFGTTSLSYNVGALVMAEGISETKTNQGDTTVTETSYMLDAAVAVTGVQGGAQDGTKVTVAAGQKATVTVAITLSDSDRKYLDEGFENGTYVEGFVTLDAVDDGVVDLNVPYLAFYGDWTKAPIFDLDFYATNKDEIDDAIDLFDKTLADAYPTRPIGSTYDDYVSYLGSYYYEQAPGSNKIAADRKYISLTNQTEGVNELAYVWAGLLRNVDYVTVVITEDSTGEVVFETVDRDIRKSYGDGGPIRPANIDIGFSAIDLNLKNNTKYTVTLKAYMDYGDGGVANNLNNTFTFPITIDFEAPTLTGCEFYTEYDKSAKKNRLYAKMAIYDNHYTMAAFPGYIGADSTADGAMFYNFERYLTPVYSEENSTTYVTYELTDYIDDIREGTVEGFNKNTFSVMLYDYALNVSTYEVCLPDEYIDLYFEQDEIVLSPNEIYDLNPILYPGTEWAELVNYTIKVNDPKNAPVRIVNNKIVAVKSGEVDITATAGKRECTLKVKVLAEGDEGYKRIDKKAADSFKLTGFYVDKAYYFLSSDQRDIGETGNVMKFLGENYNLKMYPSEKITVQWDLDAYFDNTEVIFESSNPNKVKVDPKTGTIEVISNEEGYASVTATVMLDGKATFYSKTISIEIKDPWVTSGPSLANYYGMGGLVVFPKNLAVTSIGQFAFSNYDYVPKGEGDEISEESPESTKIWFIGDETITKVIIPEGVESIGPYAFANLTALTEIVIPSTVTTIDVGAFYGCRNLTTVKGIENVKFINQSAFQGTKLSGELNLKKAIAIGDYAFAELTVENPDATDYSNRFITSRNEFTKLTLSENCKSIGVSAFSSNRALTTLDIKSDFLKLGSYAFSSCTNLTSASVNAAVIPSGTFYGCTKLASVTLGKDVAQIGEYAFGATNVSKFTVVDGNSTYATVTNGNAIYNKAGTELILAAPTLTTFTNNTVVSIGAGAFSGNNKLTTVSMPAVTSVGSYAFADCSKLATVTLGKISYLGDYAFASTGIKDLPDIGELSIIGKYAFTRTNISSVTIADGVTVGEGAFSYCKLLESVSIGNNAVIGRYAFRSAGDYGSATKVEGESYYYYPVVYPEGSKPLTTLVIGNNVTVGDYAFWFSTKLESVTLGEGAKIGKYAFYGSSALASIDLSKATSIGDYAFSGDVYYAMAYDAATQTYVNAADAFGDYIYIYTSPVLASINLSACTSLGQDAFGYCKSLTTVTLGDGVTVIPAGAFRDCESLASINLAKVTEIGEYSFTKTALTSVDLSALTTLGQYAFCEAASLASVKFTDKIENIGEGAFSYSKLLASVEGLENVKVIGDYSFAYTALTGANLSGATYIGTHAFMKETLTPFTVTLGKSLEDMGDNPFVLCKLDRFSAKEIETFNGTDYEKTVYTYDLSSTIRIIDGSIYRVVPNGLELICYCENPDDLTAKIADGTVRISAYAFAGSDVINAILPYTVRAIGHKAFFGCDDLMIVNFQSYYSPILEEEYDFYYFYSGENLPISSDFLVPERFGDDHTIYKALGVVDYFVWNVNSDPTSTFFGANFKNYIGKVESKAVMVKPVNGIGYDSFILGNYFGVTLEGAAAADNTTLAAIDAINRLPDKVALSDKAAVEAARALYDKIASYEQRALVTNLQKLLDAEKRIKDLEFLENQGGDDAPIDDGKDGLPVWAIILIVVGSVLLLGGAVVGVYFLIKYARKKESEGEEVSKFLHWLAGLFTKKDKAEEVTEDEADATKSITETEKADDATEVETAEVEAETEATEDTVATEDESITEEKTEEITEAAADEPAEETKENSDENSEDKQN